MTTTAQPATPTLHVSDENGTVAVRKLFTRMGERLELRAGAETSNRLDAIVLESVAWQDADELAENAADLAPSRREPVERAGEEWSETVTISSEFARAAVEPAGHGERLAISAPKLGYEIELGSRELAWVATQPHTTFSEWLEHPFGPGGEEHDHGH